MMLPLKSLTDARLKFMKALEFCQAWLSCQKNVWMHSKSLAGARVYRVPWHSGRCQIHLILFLERFLFFVLSLSYQMVMEDLFLYVSGVSDQYSQRWSLVGLNCYP